MDNLELNGGDQAGFIAGLTFLYLHPSLTIVKDEAEKVSYSFVILDLTNDREKNETPRS